LHSSIGAQLKSALEPNGVATRSNNAFGTE
jgi:hypothetical protein